MQFKDIQLFTRDGGYAVDIPLEDLPEQINRYIAQYGLDLSPDFQRTHVWNEDKQVKFVEFLLKNGRSSRDLFANCPGWQRGALGDFILVDGKQRLESCLKFLRGELKVFGFFRPEFTDHLSMLNSLRLHVNDLKTRAEVLQWYLDLNEGGVVHTRRELDKVRKLLAIERLQGSIIVDKSHPAPQISVCML